MFISKIIYKLIHTYSFYAMTISVKHTRKSRIFIRPNRLPALPAVVKFSTFSKIRLGELDIRHHFKMRIQILAHIVKMRLGGYQIRTLLRPVSAQKFRGIFHR